MNKIGGNTTAKPISPPKNKINPNIYQLNTTTT